MSMVLIRTATTAINLRCFFVSYLFTIQYIPFEQNGLDKVPFIPQILTLLSNFVFIHFNITSRTRLKRDTATKYTKQVVLNNSSKITVLVKSAKCLCPSVQLALNGYATTIYSYVNLHLPVAIYFSYYIQTSKKPDHVPLFL